MKQMYARVGIALLYLLAFAWPSLMGMPLRASNISLANFFGTVQVVNNGTAETYQSSNITNIKVSNFVDGGYVASASNTTMAMRTTSGADVAFMPGYGNSTWMTWVSGIGEDSALNYLFYTGNITGGKVRYFPTATGMTTLDSGTLELAANFTIEQAGYIDTSVGASKYLLHKTEAVEVYTGVVNEEVTATIYSAATTEVLAPDGVGFETNVPNVFGAATHWQATLTDDGDTSYVWNQANGWLRDTYSCTDSAIAYGPINSVTVTTMVKENAPGVCTSMTALRTHAVTYDGTSRDLGAAYVAESTIYATNPNTAVAWTWAEVDAMEIGVSLRGDTVQSARCTQVYVTVDYDPQLDVTAVGVASGEHDVLVSGEPGWADGDVLNFDGGGTSEIDCGIIHNASAKLWVSLWWRLDAPYAAGSGDMVLWSKRVDGTHQIYLRLANTDGRLHFLNDNGGVLFDITSTATSWAADTWHHTISSISNVAGARLIIDGEAAITDANNEPVPNGAGLFIGEIIGIQNWEGEIQNVIIGTDDLLPAEEVALYAGVAPGDETNYWYIDEGVGVAIIDYGTGGNDGTAGGGTSWETSTYTTGKTGRLCDFFLDVDGDRPGVNLKGASVVGNANDWYYCTNGSMPYMEYTRITVGGTLQQYIVWEYDTTFTDQSGQGHDATPSFAVDSSDANITASLLSYGPVAEADAPAYTIGAPPDFITTAPNLTGDFSTTIAPTIPGADVITEAAASSGTPVQLPWIMISAFVIMALSLTATYVMSHFGSGNSVFVKIALITVGTGAMIGTGVFDFWMLLFFLLPAIAIAWASRPQESIG